MPPSALFRLQLAADRGGGGADLEDAEHVEAEDEHQQHQDEHDPRILELIAPADFLAGTGGGAERRRGCR